MSGVRIRSRGLTGGAAWSPADLPGIAAWYKETGLLTDPAIYQWSDELLALDAVQATTDNKPTATTINGTAAALFDGSNDSLLTGAVTAIGSGDFYAASVVLFNSGANAELPLWEWGGSGGLVLRGQQAGAQLQLLHSATASIGSGAVTQDAPVLVEVQKSGTSFSVWLNGGADLGPWTYATAIPFLPRRRTMSRCVSSIFSLIDLELLHAKENL